MREELQFVTDKIIDGAGFGFHLRWEYADYVARVAAYQVESVEDDGTPNFTKKDSMSRPNPVRDLADAEVYLAGFVKADGCAELDMGSPHWCGVDGFNAHCELLNFIWHRACDLMQCEVSEPWPQVQILRRVA